MPGLVIFDCDGVLVDSEPIANRVMHEQLLAAGHDLSLTQCHELLVGRTLDDCRSIIESETGRPLPVDFMPELEKATKTAFDRNLQQVSGIGDTLARPRYPVLRRLQRQPP